MRSYSVLFRAGIAALLLAALTLSGCGRRGPLEPPPGAVASQDQVQGKDQEQPEEPEKSDKRIILDNLL